MNFNIKLFGKINRFLRFHYVTPKMKNNLKNKDFSLLCNNCIGGMIYHDFGLQFKSPTINLFYHSLDFLDFIEYYDSYIDSPLVQISNPRYDPEAPDYPVALLKSTNGNHKDLEINFLHYKSFEDAKKSWETRKRRINTNNLFIIVTIAGLPYDEELYMRCENLPCKNKVFFVNHPVDSTKYPHFFYVKGFEKQTGLGNIMTYMNLNGQRYYDQFDFVKWFNKGK